MYIFIIVTMSCSFFNYQTSQIPKLESSISDLGLETDVFELSLLMISDCLKQIILTTYLFIGLISKTEILVFPLLQSIFHYYYSYYFSL